MDFIAQKITGKAQAVLQLVIHLALLFICGMLVWKGQEIVQVMQMVGTTTHSREMKVWILMVPVPVGCTLFGIYAIGGVIKILCSLIDPALVLPMTRAHSDRPDEGHKG